MMLEIVFLCVVDFILQPPYLSPPPVNKYTCQLSTTIFIVKCSAKVVAICEVVQSRVYLNMRVFCERGARHVYILFAS